MSITAWGLALDIAGVLLIGAGTIEGSVAGGVSQLRRIIPGERLALWSKRIGWVLLLAGFILQLCAELAAP